MGIKADCAARYPFEPGVAETCSEQVHKQLLAHYDKVIASKFNVGDAFTISDVWRLTVAAYEYLTNIIQQQLAKSLWLHDFLEMNADQFLDPNPIFTFGVNAILLLIVSAILTARG